jgi:hypothetical protein
MEFGYGFESIRSQKKWFMVLNLKLKIRPNFYLVTSNLEWHWCLIVGYPFLTLDYSLFLKLQKSWF